jgi:cellulose synthase/poly-beta-1,6-N-acetylglucosamine synthase-like glycosyltransferase
MLRLDVIHFRLRRPEYDHMPSTGTSNSQSPGAPIPAISIVVIGRNEGERLSECLESVRRMRPARGEVETIYVDSASTDDSVERATRLGATVVRAEFERPCAAAARNAGWRIARAPIVLFLDGDTVLDRNFVIDSLDEFADHRVAVIFGHRREIRPKASIFNRVLDLDWVYLPGQVEFCGGDALMRRDVLERVGGFDGDLIAGEEPDLCCRIRALGFIVLHVDRPMTGHDLAMTRFSQYWWRAIRSGYAFAEIAERFRRTNSPFWSGQARRNNLHGLMMLAVGIGAPVVALFLHSLLPLVAAIGFILALSIRTAIRCKWKSDDLVTRLLYGLHSHLVKIPILFGQLKFQLDRRLQRRTALIEY